MATLHTKTDGRGTPAPYGQACEACAKAKCKCFHQPGNQACERCSRLNKECHPSTNKRRRTDTQTSGKASRIEEAVGRTAQLERRLDELVASLKQPVHASNTASRASISYLISDDTTPSSYATPSSGPRPDLNPDDIWTAVSLPLHETEARLTRFRLVYLKWAPFIYLLPTTTSGCLYRSHPMLWLSIMMTCARDDDETRRLDRLFRERLAEAMVVHCKKSVDLLLGLLVFITWYHHHCRDANGNVRMSLSLLLQMAISLVTDLKRPGNGQPQQMLNRHLYRHFQEQPEPITMEERRAFLWCFMASSVISGYLKNDPLRWNPLLEQCLAKVVEEPEYEGDEILGQMVKVQLVLERANAMRRSEEMMQGMSLPMGHYVVLLQQQLKQVKEQCPASIQDNEVLNLHYPAIELAIYELALDTNPKDPLQQRKLRLSCLDSTKAWFDRYLRTSPSEYLATAFTSAIHSAHCLGMLFFLSIVDEPIWSKDDVRKAEALVYVDRLIADMEEAIRSHGSETLSAHVQLYRTMRVTWAAGMEGTQAETQPVPEGEPAALDDMLDFGLFENDWLLSWPSIGGMY